MLRSGARAKPRDHNSNYSRINIYVHSFVVLVHGVISGVVLEAMEEVRRFALS